MCFSSLVINAFCINQKLIISYHKYSNKPIPSQWRVEASDVVLVLTYLARQHFDVGVSLFTDRAQLRCLFLFHRLLFVFHILFLLGFVFLGSFVVAFDRRLLPFPGPKFLNLLLVLFLATFSRIGLISCVIWRIWDTTLQSLSWMRVYYIIYTVCALRIL